MRNFRERENKDINIKDSKGFKDSNKKIMFLIGDVQSNQNDEIMRTSLIIP
jgi:hypothetical protein